MFYFLVYTHCFHNQNNPTHYWSLDILTLRFPSGKIAPVPQVASTTSYHPKESWNRAESSAYKYCTKIHCQVTNQLGHRTTGNINPQIYCMFVGQMWVVCPMFDWVQPPRSPLPTVTQLQPVQCTQHCTCTHRRTTSLIHSNTTFKALAWIVNMTNEIWMNVHREPPSHSWTNAPAHMTKIWAKHHDHRDTSALISGLSQTIRAAPGEHFNSQ